MKKSVTSNNKRIEMYSWVIKIFLITIALSTVMSLIAETSLHSLTLPLAIIVLLLFIFMGVFFDTIGVAIATVSITPFISMASKKVIGATESLYLIKRADIVSNLCNDVVGDICGIISGSAGAIIGVTLLKSTQNFSVLWVSVLISAIIASLTVSGKAVGKIIAMKENRKIVLAVGKLIHSFLLIWKRKKNGKNT